MSRSRVRRSAGILVGSAALLASAAPAALAGDCNPTGGATCLAPFPSNFWATPDTSSPTGLRGDVSDDILRPELLSQLPTADGISPSGIFNGASGFSAGVGAVFEFAGATGSVPYDGGSSVVAYDLTAGKRVPVHAFVSGFAKDTTVVGKASNVVQVFPRARWEYRHTILVAVTDSLSVAGTADAKWPEIVARPQSSQKASDYVAEVDAALGTAGLDRSRVRNATVFTVRDRAEVVDRTQRLMDDTMARNHPVKNVQVSWDILNPQVAATVTGQVRLDNYRTRGGTGPVDWSGNTRSDEWAPFRLTLPENGSNGNAPVAIYTHGIGAFKESDVTVTQMNAQRGLATFSIDWPNHGARSGPNGGNLLQLLAPKNLGTLSGMFNQATIDMAGVLKALKTVRFDVMSRKSLLNPYGQGRDGVQDVSNARISMEGTSLGGVLGANFAGLAPALDGIDFHVTGVGLSHAISQTELWRIFGAILPANTTGTEETVFMAALQQEVDYADGINTIDYARYPRAGQTAKPMLIITGAGDNAVPNPTSIALANLVDLPLTGPQLYYMPGVRRTEDYDPGGYTIRQYPPYTGPVNIPLISGFTTHLVFMQPAAFDAQHQFIQRFVKAPR